MASLPAKTNTVTLVNANAVLTGAVASKSLKAVAGRDSQFAQLLNAVELVELPPRNRPKIDRAGNSGRARFRAVKNVRRPAIRERAYHDLYYNGCRARGE
jgi:hypothetical protein